MVTLWCLMRSPLMLGGHLPDTPPETLALLTCDDVLALLGSDASREVVRDGDLVVWTAEAGDVTWAAVFWLGDDPTGRVVHLADLGVTEATGARDVWSGATLEVRGGALTLAVPAHGVRLVRLG